MIYQAADKNNGHLHRRLMGHFCRFLNDSVLKEIHLTGQLFTWSNKCSHPTLERIDRAFMTSEWEDLFPTCNLQVLSSSFSDHAPLLLRTVADQHFKK
jgi:hypothetical protein